MDDLNKIKGFERSWVLDASHVFCFLNLICSKVWKLECAPCVTRVSGMYKCMKPHLFLNPDYDHFGVPVSEHG